MLRVQGNRESRRFFVSKEVFSPALEIGAKHSMPCLVGDKSLSR